MHAEGSMSTDPLPNARPMQSHGCGLSVSEVLQLPDYLHKRSARAIDLTARQELTQGTQRGRESVVGCLLEQSEGIASCLLLGSRQLKSLTVELGKDLSGTRPERVAFRIWSGPGISKV